MLEMNPTQVLDEAINEAIFLAGELGFPIYGGDGAFLTLPPDPLLHQHLAVAREYLNRPLGIEEFQIYNDLWREQE